MSEAGVHFENSNEPAPAEEGREIPTYRLAFDEAAFERLDRADKDAYAHQIQRLEALGYLGFHGLPDKELAFIDLREFPSFEDYARRCRRVHKATAVRQALKAERTGYYSKFFNPRVFVADIVTVNTSAPERQGGPMSQHYFMTVEERGGYPTSLEPEIPPNQALSWSRHFGIFRKKPGHRQGELVVGEQLMAYAVVRRCGEFLTYSTLIGHADYLAGGIIYKMHLDLVKAIIDQHTAQSRGHGIDPSLNGIHYVFHARYYVAQPGLMTWKKRMAFRPGYFLFDHSERLAELTLEEDQNLAQLPQAATPCVVISESERSLAADLQRSGFAAMEPAERRDLVLLGGDELQPGAKLGFLRVLADPEVWAGANSTLIGSSLIAHHSPVLGEAVACAARKLAPSATVYWAEGSRTEIRPGPAAVGLADWLMRYSAGLRSGAVEPPAESPRTLAQILERALRLALAVDRIIDALGGKHPVRNVAAIGRGAGVIAYCLLGRPEITERPYFAIVEPSRALHGLLQQLYDACADAGGPSPSVTMVEDVGELDIGKADWDLALFDAPIWRIPRHRLQQVFTDFWAALSEHGLIAVNAVVRSGKADSEEAHDRNFAHALPRDELISMLAFDREPALYRAGSAWSAAEPAELVPAAAYGTDSFLVSVKTM